MSDHKNPRHVLFYDNKYKSDTLLVLDKKAITIICEKKKERYFFKTCYRMANFRNISDIQLAFKKVMTDLDFQIHMNVCEWNRKLRSKRYSNINKYLQANW